MDKSDDKEIAVIQATAIIVASILSTDGIKIMGNRLRVVNTIIEDETLSVENLNMSLSDLISSVKRSLEKSFKYYGYSTRFTTYDD